MRFTCLKLYPLLFRSIIHNSLLKKNGYSRSFLSFLSQSTLEKYLIHESVLPCFVKKINKYFNVSDIEFLRRNYNPSLTMFLEMVFHFEGTDPPSCESSGAKFISRGRPKSLNLLLRSYFSPYRIPTVNEIRWDHVPMRSIVSPYGWYWLPRL